MRDYEVISTIKRLPFNEAVEFLYNNREHVSVVISYITFLYGPSTNSVIPEYKREAEINVLTQLVGQVIIKTRTQATYDSLLKRLNVGVPTAK